MEITIARVGQPLHHHEKCFNRHFWVMGRGLREIDAALVCISSNLACISFNLARLSADMESIKVELVEMRREIRAMRSEMRWMGGGIVGFMTFALGVSTYINSLT